MLENYSAGDNGLTGGDFNISVVSRDVFCFVY